MKKILTVISLILIIFISIFIFSCKKELSEAKNIINSLERELSQLKLKNIQKEKELEKYNTMINNLNALLSTVYYGSAISEREGKEKNFTAFSVYYKNKFYLITAGHCIEYNGVKYTDFKFKSNNINVWIYPTLLYYENDYENNRDFAIFYYQPIRIGLIIDEIDKKSAYVLGNTQSSLNFLKIFDTAEDGESGSPILSSGFKLVGLVIKNNNEYTPIEIVTEAIDTKEFNLE